MRCKPWKAMRQELTVCIAQSNHLVIYCVCLWRILPIMCQGAHSSCMCQHVPIYAACQLMLTHTHTHTVIPRTHRARSGHATKSKHKGAQLQSVRLLTARNLAHIETLRWDVLLCRYVEMAQSGVCIAARA